MSTTEAWAYLETHLPDIRDVVARFLPVPRMEVPNSRIAIVAPDGTEVITEYRASVPLPVKYDLAAFDAAVEARDVQRIVVIMESAWLRAPEDRGVYRIPGFTEMCNLLDGSVDGFLGDEDG